MIGGDFSSCDSTSRGRLAGRLLADDDLRAARLGPHARGQALVGQQLVDHFDQRSQVSLRILLGQALRGP